ncbi:baseplate multidomain protein megatron [Blastochloris viridis]|uniref:Gene transfer agent host specificity protein n=1 Tax=Blastochloris viridis TaxID=1079 RepID=A0A0H5BFZ9_BLAVI|nr:glycoside hydrolase TIM-barrel-like domain-containing protein [Blastochloris viridis]ALK08994.1 hypothetical protein BVIR_1205 [Blastochloris viridis]BAS01146.1 gene transfer agent host specificity protein [Blastochloris viridis]CUU41655.1 hypothetical protein BVIRIDIS_06480 [Blastochloris viridis]
MAQLVLTIAGSAFGQAVGGGLGQGLGALFGATIGGLINQQLFGPQTDRRVVESGKITDVRLSGSAYGQVRPKVYGRGRLPANIIWARGIREEVRTTTETTGAGDGKGGFGGGGNSGGQTVTTTTYHYYADVALGLSEGPLTSVYRIWVDGQPLNTDDVDEVRIYYGDEAQQPDPLIEAVEGADRTPAFRGTAYVVLENLYLTAFGNRFPNFEVEVFCGSPSGTSDARHLIESICLIPASGEFAYDPDIVFSNRHGAGTGFKAAINVHAGSKRADFAVAIDNLKRELPNVEWVALVYAWFGTSLDVGACALRPECEVGVYVDQVPESRPHVWSVAGIGRLLYLLNGAVSGTPHWPTVSSYTRPDGSSGLSYGGTIDDGAMVRATQHLKARGLKVLFYPFIMMDIPPPDPAPFPWRGRITGAAADVPGFFTRPDGYLRFIRHCLTLCEQAGGVDGFVIGSEMVALNRILDAGGAYPAVPYWQQIAAEAKTRLGSTSIVTYAANWDEYRYHDRGNATVDFPLDALWADPNIDVVGIDAYFPLTDAPRAVHDKAAIRAGWAGGELIDYYYASAVDRDLARRGLDPQRSVITDRFWALKDLKYWWETEHVPRVNGTPSGPPTAWVPQSKPIWFTEFGIPTVNCATNQPNVFIDPKSSESFAPYYSTGTVDRVVQRAAIEATEDYWRDPANNPVSSLSGASMLGRRFVWCWDARPYPWFPTLSNVWSDGVNFRLGHWINGKIGNMRLSDIVADLCRRAGLASSEFDASALDDEVVGYVVTERKSIRDMIAVLQTAHFFDCVERDGKLVFVKRGGGTLVPIDPNDLGASDSDSDRSKVKVERTQDTELPIAVDVVHIDEGRDYQSSTVTIKKQVGRSDSVTTFSLPIVLSIEQAQTIGQRALREMWQGREAIDLRLPTRWLKVDPTDLIEVPIDGVLRRYRVTSITYGKPGLVLVRGQATDGGNPDYVTAPTGSGSMPPVAADPVPPVKIELLDMPIIIDAHDASAASFYMAACPIGGGRFRGASLFQPTADGLDYTTAAVATLASTMGATVTVLPPGPVWTWDRGNSVEVQLDDGTLQSLPDERILAGANAALIGDEVIQFATAELIAASRYRLSRLLRGQRGTEHEVTTHPAGVRFVLLDPARQVRPAFSVSRLGIATAYKGAPVPEGPAGSHAIDVPFTNGGRGLKPFAPVQLKARREASGDVRLAWIRRSRVSGDAWFAEIPLGEEAEDYDVAILNGEAVVRTTRVGAPSLVYTAAQQTADFGSQPAALKWRVAQVSRVYGAGQPTEVTSVL